MVSKPHLIDINPMCGGKEPIFVLIKHLFHLFGTEAILGAYSKRLNFIIKDAPVAPIAQEIPRFWKL